MYAARSADPMPLAMALTALIAATSAIPALMPPPRAATLEPTMALSPLPLISAFLPLTRAGLMRAATRLVITVATPATTKDKETNGGGSTLG